MHSDPKSQPRIYFAGPLFSAAEISFNAQVVKELEEFAQVFLPQRDGMLMTDLIEEGETPEVASLVVFNRDMDAIANADILIAVLDGRSIDEGVAFELGVAYSQSKKCIGLQTDSRRLAEWGNNPMISGALETIFHNSDELISFLKNQICLPDSTAQVHQSKQLQ